jgi:hypothetical protein
MTPPIPILAASGGDLVPFIVVGVFLLVKWLISKANEASPPAPPTGGSRPPPANEEERARRFREALGLPPDGGPATMRAPAPSTAEMRRERPTSMHGFPPPPPPPPQRKAAEFPVPPIIYEQRPRRQKKAVPPPPRPREEFSSLDELPAPKTRAEQITAGELKLPEYHELQTRSSEVQAIPFERRASSGSASHSKPSAAAELRALLRRRSSLRDAILLREILSPPPGLQSPQRSPGPGT